MAFRLAPTALVASLYVAYFNRAVESAGLTYWHNQYRAELAKSGNEDDTSAQLSAWIYQGGQDEAALAEPISDAEFIANIYENLLGRGRPALEGVDRDGFNFWLDKLENGHVSRAEFAAAFISGISAVNDPEGAAKFALVLKTALTWARSDASQGLDDAALRAAGIKALQDALYPPEPQPEPEPEPQPEPQPQPQPEPEPEGPIQLVHGDISVLGTPGDDVFVGTVDGSPGFLDTLTQLDGREGHDRLEITDTVTANTTFWLNNNLMLQDIEELSITTERAFLSLDGLGDLARFGDLALFELISRGNAVAEVSVAAATDVDIDTANYQFSLYGGHGASTFGSAQVTTRGTNSLTIVERHDVTIDDVSVGNGLVSVALEDVGGTIVLNTPGLTNLSLFDVEARAEVSVNVSGTENIGITLNGVGVNDLVDLSVAASDPLATGEISLISNGASQNIVALTSAPGMSLFIGGAGALALSWHADAPAGVAAINAGTASGGVFVDLTLSGFNSVNATFGSGNDHILVDLPGSVDGGAGNDTFSVRATGLELTGGAGNDNFDLREVARDGGASFPGMITITDFEAGDQIQLATPLLAGHPLVSEYVLAFPGESLEDTLERQVPPAPNTLMLYQIDGSDAWNGFYLLAQDGNPTIDGNDLLIRLEGIQASDEFRLSNGVFEFFVG